MSLHILRKVISFHLMTSTLAFVTENKPNIVLLFADDLGYGDLEAYGHPTSSTPHLNKLAANGLKFTQFYSSSCICSPSRAGLLTGRYHTRSGIYPTVFLDTDKGGLPLNEITIAEMLRPIGYKSTIIGKWHLGVGNDGMYLPTNQGFDHYYGIPFSQNQCYCPICFYPNDACDGLCQKESATCALYNDTFIIEQPVDLTTLAQRYAEEARSWINNHAKRGEPFFIYLPFQHTHQPQFAGKMFRNSTVRGVFGDSLAELDWVVGQVMDQLEASDVLNNTLVFFTSDNGPSQQLKEHGGNAGLLKCAKGTTYEGGHRVPAIAHWPGRIPSGERTLHVASTLDLMPTISALTGSILPDVALDGYDMSSILFQLQNSKREDYYYYPVSPNPTDGVWALRYQQYKAHFYTMGSDWSGGEEAMDSDCRPNNYKRHDPPRLFDLNTDPSEQHDLQHDPTYIGIIKKMKSLKREFDDKMVWGESQRARGGDIGLEPCCSPSCIPFPSCCTCRTPQSKQAFIQEITRPEF